MVFWGPADEIGEGTTFLHTVNLVAGCCLPHHTQTEFVLDITRSLLSLDVHVIFCSHCQ